MANNSIIIKRVDVRATLESLKPGQSVTFTVNRDTTTSRITSIASRMNREGEKNFTSSNRGIEMVVTRNR